MVFHIHVTSGVRDEPVAQPSHSLLQLAALQQLTVSTHNIAKSKTEAEQHHALLLLRTLCKKAPVVVTLTKVIKFKYFGTVWQQQFFCTYFHLIPFLTTFYFYSQLLYTKTLRCTPYKTFVTFVSIFVHMRLTCYTIIIVG